MNIPEVQKLVDQLSRTLVLLDADHEDTLDGLPEQFGDLAAFTMELGREAEAAACRAAASLAGRLLGGEVDWQQGLDILGRTVNALQACLHDECSADEAGFPDELSNGLPPTPEPAEPDADVPPEPESAADLVHEEDVPLEEPASEASTEGPGLVDESIMGEFLGRQADILLDVEKQLLSLEHDDSEADSEGLLRFFHTLKGESALLGLTDVADLCHATEDMMQQESLQECVDRLLDVKDWFIATFKYLAEEGPAPESLAIMLERLRLEASDPETQPPEILADDSSTESSMPVDTGLEPETEVVEESASSVEVSAPTEVAAVAYEMVDYTSKNILEGDVDLIQDFVEEAVEHLDASEAHLLTIESDPKESEALNAVFRGFHTIKGLAGFIELDHVKDLAHKAENLLDMARRNEIELVGPNMDLVFESVDMMKRLVEGVAEAMGGSGTLTTEDKLPGLMSRLVAATSGEEVSTSTAASAPAPEPDAETSVETPAELPEVSVPISVDETIERAKAGGFVPLGNMGKRKSAPAPAPAAETPAPTPAASATPQGATPPAAAAGPAKAKAPLKMKEAVRVDAERLDRLIETIGELVIAESMVSQSPELKNTQLSVKLAKDLDHLDKICRELQEIGMSLRMVPVRPVFQKMARLVRDLSKKQSRKVDFVMSGEDTELDKNVVDKIGDPLVHMVRNSVDHGIEPDPADRLKDGKPERGRVELRAFHKGGNICIEIQDDGRGLDREAILAKAISRGLVREGEKLSDREIFNMIFEPGFSTAKQVTDISGRGVGMDVVRRNIEELRGTCDISSEKGKGSTFSIKLPLTLAIIEGMVIVVGQEHYIIPTLSVVRLIRPRPEDLNHVFDRGEMLAFEGAHLPLFRLSTLFDVEECKSSPDEAVVVVVEDEGKKIGLMADDLLGQQSIVIKSLGESVQGTDGVAGGAIMSNGNVALILDVAGLTRVAHSVDTTRNVGVMETAAATLDHSVDQVVSEAVIDEAETVETDTEDIAEIEVSEEPVETGV